MTCKDCLNQDSCSIKNKCSKNEIPMASSKSMENYCNFFKDRYRFVELPKARWLRHSPDKIIMREFHKQGIGRGMDENSIFWTCSNCGGWGNLNFKYCPSCGAKIEEAEQALKEREENETDD